MLEEEDDHGAGISFAVSDTGIGIPLGEQQRLFVAFDQGSATTNRLFGGTGPGLSICHHWPPRCMAISTSTVALVKDRCFA